MNLCVSGPDHEPSTRLFGAKKTHKLDKRSSFRVLSTSVLVEKTMKISSKKGNAFFRSQEVIFYVCSLSRSIKCLLQLH